MIWIRSNLRFQKSKQEVIRSLEYLYAAKKSIKKVESKYLELAKDPFAALVKCDCIKLFGPFKSRIKFFR